MSVSRYCPKCFDFLVAKVIEEGDVRTLSDCPALSRRDNKTRICDLCGLAEGIADLTGEPEWKARKTIGLSFRGSSK